MRECDLIHSHSFAASTFVNETFFRFRLLLSLSLHVFRSLLNTFRFVHSKLTLVPIFLSLKENTHTLSLVRRNSKKSLSIIICMRTCVLVVQTGNILKVAMTSGKCVTNPSSQAFLYFWLINIKKSFFSFSVASFWYHPFWSQWESASNPFAHTHQTDWRCLRMTGHIIIFCPWNVCIPIWQRDVCHREKSKSRKLFPSTSISVSESSIDSCLMSCTKNSISH